MNSHKIIRILQVVHSLPIAGTEKLVYDMISHFGSDFEFYILCLDELGILGKELEKKKFFV